MDLYPDFSHVMLETDSKQLKMIHQVVVVVEMSII